MVRRFFHADAVDCITRTWVVMPRMNVPWPRARVPQIVPTAVPVQCMRTHGCSRKPTIPTDRLAKGDLALGPPLLLLATWCANCA